jgi:hypothetical protein
VFGPQADTDEVRRDRGQLRNSSQQGQQYVGGSHATTIEDRHDESAVQDPLQQLDENRCDDAAVPNRG